MQQGYRICMTAQDDKIRSVHPRVGCSLITLVFIVPEADDYEARDNPNALDWYYCVSLRWNESRTCGSQCQE